ncbi:MAG: rhomboid family intramembrane serine protease [Chitinophagales bacterium]|nr:rhomboid family intramembrane serine protease [Chitinophagales bacterium]
MFNQLNTRSVTFNIIAINVILYIITVMTGEWMYMQFALHYPANPLFQPVQIVTHMFMHGSMGHIFFNMFALFMFGSVLERVWGPKRFLAFYFITGFGAVALHLLVQAIIVYNFTGTFSPTLEMVQSEPGVISTFFSSTVGASGALFGILVGFGMLFPNTELYLLFFPFPIKAKYFISFYVLLEIYLGFSMYGSDNVAHFAHLGGALFGFILVKIWNRKRDFLY